VIESAPAPVTSFDLRRRRHTEAVGSATTSSMKMRPTTTAINQLITSGDHSTVGTHDLDTAGPICTIWISTVCASSHRTDCDGSASSPARHAGVAWGQGAPDPGVSRCHKGIRVRQQTFRLRRDILRQRWRPKRCAKTRFSCESSTFSTSTVAMLARTAPHRECASL
jgi:hypothetical protein